MMMMMNKSNPMTKGQHPLSQFNIFLLCFVVVQIVERKKRVVSFLSIESGNHSNDDDYHHHHLVPQFNQMVTGDKRPEFAFFFSFSDFFFSDSIWIHSSITMHVCVCVYVVEEMYLIC